MYFEQSAALNKTASVQIQAALREIGIDVSLHSQLSSVIYGGYGANGTLARGKYDIALYNWIAGIDPDRLDAFRAGIRKRYTDEQILAELKACAERLGRSPTMREFSADSKTTVHPQTVIEHFGSWNRAKRRAGLVPRRFAQFGVVPGSLALVTAILVLFGVKVSAKIIGVFPSTRPFRIRVREAWYTTMMMSTGLTFGTISALFGLSNGLITQTQYPVLVTVVIGSAVVPTLLAQSFFRPATARPYAEEVATALEPVPAQPAQPAQIRARASD